MSRLCARKEQGHSAYVSDFLSDVGGRLALKDYKYVHLPSILDALLRLCVQEFNMMVGERVKTR